MGVGPRSSGQNTGSVECSRKVGQVKGGEGLEPQTWPQISVTDSGI